LRCRRQGRGCLWREGLRKGPFHLQQTCLGAHNMSLGWDTAEVTLQTTPLRLAGGEP
jgi:hypothetical protein